MVVNGITHTVSLDLMAIERESQRRAEELIKMQEEIRSRIQFDPHMLNRYEIITMQRGDGPVYFYRKYPDGRLSIGFKSIQELNSLNYLK